MTEQQEAVDALTKPVIEKCGFIDGWLQCDLEVGHEGLHEDHWLGGKPAPRED